MIEPDIVKWRQLGTEIVSKIEKELENLKKNIGATLEDADLSSFKRGPASANSFFQKCFELIKQKEEKALDKALNKAYTEY